MPEAKLPYLTAYGNIGRVLEKIQAAATPPRFSQDFLAETLGMTGGGARPLIPYLKRTGFLDPSGTPTDLYKSFRNDDQTLTAGAKALRIGYQPLFNIDEMAQRASDAKLKGMIVQVTGFDNGSKTVSAIAGSFRALAGFSDPDYSKGPDRGALPPSVDEPVEEPGGGLPNGLNLGYTINLHLPATSDVAVFNAIFKSLREHLLR